MRMRDIVLIEEMTWPEVREAIAKGKKRVIVMLAAMEAHGPHLPIGTDTYLGYAHAERLARRLGDTLVAPVVTLGYSETFLPMAGTVSLAVSTFHAVVLDVCRSLARHGFAEIVLLPSHGGNYPVLRDVVPRVREEHPTIRILARTTFDTEATNQFAAREGLDISRMGLHAGQSETSRMLACRPDLVEMDKACEGFTGDLSPYFPEFWRSGYLPPMDTISLNGILGDARESTSQIGERLFQDATERLAQMIESGALG
jgi:creatinine amidohydrolase